MSAKILGVPIKLLHEAEGHVVTVELKNGEAYRGLLDEAEDTMNVRLSEGELSSEIYLSQKLTMMMMYNS